MCRLMTELMHRPYFIFGDAMGSGRLGADEEVGVNMLHTGLCRAYLTSLLIDHLGNGVPCPQFRS
jgi:hypothetical protein